VHGATHSRLLEPPILDFSLDLPQQEEQNQVGRVSQEGGANCGATHSRLFPRPATTRGAKPGRESQPRGRGQLCMEPLILDFSLDQPQQEEQNHVATN
jgi:hypothetical protein